MYFRINFYRRYVDALSGRRAPKLTVVPYLIGKNAAQYPTARWDVKPSLIRDSASYVGEHGGDDPGVACQWKVEL